MSNRDHAPLLPLWGAVALGIGTMMGLGESLRLGPPTIVAIAVEIACGGLLAAVVFLIASRPLQRQLVEQQAERRLIDARLAHLERLHDVSEQIDVAIDLAATEDECLNLVGKFLDAVFPDRDNTVFLCAQADHRLIWAIPTAPEGLGTPIQLDGGDRCVSIARTRSHIVSSSADIDACSHLALHDCDVSSYCAPIFSGNVAVAVAHSAGPTGDLPGHDETRLAEMVLRHVARRMTQLRTLRDKSTGNHSDQLTGLASHTTAHKTLRELLSSNQGFSLALCDVDGMRQFNQLHGDQAGDTALQLFSDVLSATLRPGDLVSRYGGDKFLAIFPACTGPHAQSAMERVRESLVLSFATATVDPFTVSVGIATSEDVTSVEELVERADIAVTMAKNAGGGRVMLASSTNAL